MKTHLASLVVGCAVLCGGYLHALETDQYYSWGLPLVDSTAAVNAKLNLELERAIASFPSDRPPQSCQKVVVAYRSRMRSLLLHEIQVWAWNSQWVDRIPDGGDEHHEYRRTNLYSNHPPIDTGTWMPFTPTIKVAGVRIGTDKLAHFVSSGWTYYGEYRDGLKNGNTPEQAEREAVHRGLVEESLVLGGKTSGVEAIADIEASFAGMHFYRDLCNADDSILKLEEGGWVISRPVDLRDYVTPRWDESYLPPVYSNSRWRKVRPVLEGYCDRLDDPQVVAMRRSYREMDGGSPVSEVVAERVAAGKMSDPAQFTIEAVCAEPDPSRDSTPRPSGDIDPVEPAIKPAVTKEDLIAEEEDRRRFALGLTGLHVTYPQVVSASIAVMSTSRPASYDCTTPCTFKGPFAQIEPGLGGAKLSLGWARVTGNTNSSGSFLAAGFVGAVYKATVLQTWGDLGWVEGGRTYAGVELGLPIAQAYLGLGLLYRVDNTDSGRWLVTGGAGWGF